jgi:hypothetical protein
MAFFEQYLENLLVNKSFEELSKAEKKYVLEYLSEDDYAKYQVFLATSVATLKLSAAALIPAPETARNLKQAFKARHKKTWVWPDLNFRYPFQLRLVLPILALFAVFLSLHFFNRDTPKTPHLAAGQIKKDNLNIMADLSQPAITEAEKLPLQTAKQRNNLSAARKVITTPKVPGQVKGNALAADSFIEKEGDALAAYSEIGIDILEEEMLDADNYSIPGMTTGLLMPDAE